HPAGEAFLPVITVLLAASAGWRSVWILFAMLLLLACPLLLYLGTGPFALNTPQGTPDTTTDSRKICMGDRSRGDVLRDHRFYLLLPTLLLPGFILTGLFIHQARLIELRGWALSWFAA